MTDPSALSDLILDRLTQSDLNEDAQLLAYAAVAGEDEFAQALTQDAALPQRLSREQTPAALDPAGAYLTKISVEGFRGVGPKVTLPLIPGPGLTIVTGRNGSGKSSLAEALEIALRTTSVRWEKKKSLAWSQGWRNLHHSPCQIAIGLALEGQAGPPAVVVRRWGKDASSYTDATSQLLRQGKSAADPAELGWADALQTYSPMMSHDELGEVLTAEPKELYDKLSDILGLGALTQGRERLRKAHQERDLAAKASSGAARSIAEQCSAVADPRAQEAAKLLRARKRNLDRLGELATDSGVADPEFNQLMNLGRIEVPVPALDELATHLASACRAVEQLPLSPDAQVAALLSAALTWQHEHQARKCPVCGTGDLNAEWAAAARAKVDQISEEEQARNAAIRTRDDAERRLRSAIPAPPAALHSATSAEAATVLAQWQAMFTLPASATDLATHVQALLPALRTDVAALIDHTQTEITARQDAWRPLAQQLAGWLPGAHAVDTPANSPRTSTRH